MEKIFFVGAIVVFIINTILMVRKIAEEKIEELQYMLICAERRMEMYNKIEETGDVKDRKQLQRTKDIEMRYIEGLKEEIQNYWGTRFIRK